MGPASPREPTAPIPRPAQPWITQQDECLVGVGGKPAPASGTQLLLRCKLIFMEFLPTAPHSQTAPARSTLCPHSHPDLPCPVTEVHC